MSKAFTIKTMFTVVAYLLLSNVIVPSVSGAGACGKTPVNTVAASMSSCLVAAKSATAKVPPACCARVTAMIKSSPACLCAVFLSPLVKNAGVNPAVAVSIPKRCNIKNRPAGHKCGRYVLP
ncbi:hypothetical protein AMTRI_Chr04g181180 [Amborella trichopoda]|uniref:non-specific lipid-transfer protein 3 n=1 Tax=Amborella trichopoda TaxID=13333 RepID=UPI0005D3917F|nr:non-specific lipid-transfer protein 3 [Amborella trichopoda]|eukprot:XP_011625266.1 non-specific lipid-transfer protein 3 [Amborella trichopoda]